MSRTPPTPATDERALLERVFRHGFSDGWRSNQTGRQSEPLAASGAWHFYVADGALQKSVEATTPATDEREAVAQWCSGCHEVRSVDCYRAGCPKSDTEEREAVAHAIELCATPYISEALAECALSALAPIRAAEILAAEANERARVVAWLRASEAKAEPSHRDRWWVLKYIADAIERNEHGEGK